MQNKLESVLKPYEDNQPNNLFVQCNNSQEIQRIPHMVDAQGDITKEFQTFYNCVVNALEYRLTHGKHNWKLLYEISDKFLDYEDFCELLDSLFGETLEKYAKNKTIHRNMDVEVNIERFKKTHRNILCGFNWSVQYMNIQKDLFDIENKISPKLISQKTELLFTYRYGKFVVISNFCSFVQSTTYLNG